MNLVHSNDICGHAFVLRFDDAVIEYMGGLLNVVINGNERVIWQRTTREQHKMILSEARKFM